MVFQMLPGSVSSSLYDQYLHRSILIPAHHPTIHIPLKIPGLTASSIWCQWKRLFVFPMLIIQHATRNTFIIFRNLFNFVYGISNYKRSRTPRETQNERWVNCNRKLDTCSYYLTSPSCVGKVWKNPCSKQKYWSRRLLWIRSLPLFSLALFSLLSFFYVYCFSPTSGKLPRLKFCFPPYFGITRRISKNKNFR